MDKLTGLLLTWGLGKEKLLQVFQGEGNVIFVFLFLT